MNQAASESRPETDAALLAQGVSEQLVGRVSFRRAMRRAVQTAMRGRRPRRAGAVRRPPGRRRDVPHASGTARAASRCTRCGRRSTTARPRRKTTMGAIGVKVWVYHGDEVPLPEQETERARARATARARGARRRAAGASTGRPAEPTPGSSRRAAVPSAVPRADAAPARRRAEAATRRPPRLPAAVRRRQIDAVPLSQPPPATDRGR